MTISIFVEESEELVGFALCDFDSRLGQSSVEFLSINLLVAIEGVHAPEAPAEPHDASGSALLESGSNLVKSHKYFCGHLNLFYLC